MGLHSRPPWAVAIAVIVLAAGGAWGQRRAPLAKAGPLLEMALARPPPELGRLDHLSITPAVPEPVLGVFIQTALPRAQLRALGARVDTVIPGERLATARVPVSVVPALLNAPGVLRVELAQRAVPALDVATGDTTQADPFAYLGSNTQAIHATTEGEGVIVGIVDSGIDWEHEDFIDDATGQSRILFIWDQTLTPEAGESSPTGFSYGVEYTQEDINDEIDGTPVGYVRTRDTEGHGTKVAGVAVGDGSATQRPAEVPPGTYEGAAPAADIIVVKTPRYYNQVVDAVAYIFGRAAGLGQPAVVNLSLGGLSGPHDGTLYFTRGICGLTGPGHIVVAAGGNWAHPDRPMHAELNPPGESSHTTTFYITSGQTRMHIDLWHHGGDAYTCTLACDDGSVTAAAGESVDLTFGTTWLWVSNNTFPYANGDGCIFMMADADPGSYVPSGFGWSIALTKTASNGNGGVDMWLSWPYYTTSHFTSADASNEEVVSEPADGVGVALETPDPEKWVIAVGAHNTKNRWVRYAGNEIYFPDVRPGDIAYFSSIGPNRSGSNSNPDLDGMPKPDLTAPGQYIATALPQDAAGSSAYWTYDGEHVMTRGTSVSAPHIAGIVALMLADQPSLTPAQARWYLISQTRDADCYCSPSSHDPVWGYGKVDAGAAFNSMGPTAVLVTGASAVRRQEAIELAWELGPLGQWIAANVLRRVGPAGPMQRLTETPVMLDEGSNRFVDPAPPPGCSYQIELLDFRGGRMLYGPLVPR